ncbi:NADPH-cytochrome P450 reductase [Fusarium tjaetaba]|uniref:NADPH-cytochrome P450 reductase n=1 Tax=Fusarium tjaetaba TaxID=1567544 RepID=A0A8H5V6W8_9HYPO|nr:NADPH-cytochrome P450 reductase [Fusarium tjaetaba]KAF5613322.1 NADPH-cytochrome P450 reductase [Fusarium tjaetaba]
MQSSAASGAFWNDTLHFFFSFATAVVHEDSWWTTSPKLLSDETSTSHEITGLFQNTEKDCIVFWDSQTGTAEGFASRFVKEGKSRFKLQLITADIQEYDFTSLAEVSSDKVVIFFLATYGDGEPKGD